MSRLSWMTLLINGPFALEPNLIFFLIPAEIIEATSCNAIAKSARHENVGVFKDKE